MELNYIRLKNFRQYVDQNIIFAHPEGNKNFTIILGANGAGKTNLLNAITWCLYGEELHLGKKYKGLPIVNTTTFKELKKGESCDVEVQIQFEEENGQKILITRTLKILKTNESNFQKIGSSLVMMRQRGRDWINVVEPQYMINKLIPKDLEEYFFFDGERLDRYFREETGETIRKAVFRISQLGLLENAIQHLKRKREEILRNTRGLSSKAKEIQEFLDIQRRSLEKDVEELKKMKAEKSEAERKEAEFSTYLRNMSAEKISSLEEQRIELERDIQRLKDEILRLEDERFDFLLNFTPIIYLYKPLLKASGIIGAREESGEIPPDYKRVFIEKLLKRGKCICGTDLIEGTIQRKNVEDLLRRSDEISEISEEIIALNINIRSMLSRLKDFREKQIEYGRRLNELQVEMERKSLKFKEITEEIGKSDIEKVKFWESKRQEWKSIKEELIGKIAVKEAQIKRRNNIIRANEIQLKRELKKEKKYEKLLKILDFLDKSLEVAVEIKSSIMEDIRKEIEEKTKEQFFNLIWKKETYIDVKIDSSYNISVLHRSGMEGIGTLSAGERQVLALSFMAALNSVSGFDVPIIIDTPLGRISKEPKKSIARNLPNYLKGKQVTLLVTEEEYTPEVRTLLADRVGKSYIIEFKETGDGNLAEVVPL